MSTAAPTISSAKSMREFLEIPYTVRVDECTRIVRKYPGRVPVICDWRDGKQAPLDRIKYIVPETLSIGQFVATLRSRMRLQPTEAVMTSFFPRNVFPSMTATVGDAYAQYQHECGFLYIQLNKENTFG